MFSTSTNTNQNTYTENKYIPKPLLLRSARMDGLVPCSNDNIPYSLFNFEIEHLKYKVSLYEEQIWNLEQQQLQYLKDISILRDEINQLRLKHK
jgi:hypothetical protein